MLQCHPRHSRARWTDLTRSPECGVTASGAGPTGDGISPALRLVCNAGDHGTQWDFVGIDGQSRSLAEICCFGAPTDNGCSLLVLAFVAVDKSVNQEMPANLMVGRESLFRA